MLHVALIVAKKGHNPGIGGCIADLGTEPAFLFVFQVLHFLAQSSMVYDDVTYKMLK